MHEFSSNIRHELLLDSAERRWRMTVDARSVTTASSKQKALASQFVDSLKQPPAKAILQSYGFAVR